ncbi:MAG TPA: hypothetical protein V6D21_14015, partial [Candidatus Obscuribacterales bacterium]
WGLYHGFSTFIFGYSIINLRDNYSIGARRSCQSLGLKPENVSRERGSDNWLKGLNPTINPVEPVLTLKM